MKFERVSKYADVEDVPLPTRQTANSAGYDFAAIEDIVIPPLDYHQGKIHEEGCRADYYAFTKPFTLATMAELTKKANTRPTLVPTGIKCQLDPGTYLELSMRSSVPLKDWLILGNGVGIIDSDYYNNQDNEGHIFFQLINLSPFAIKLYKGDRIGQGIIKRYEVVDDDNPNSDERVGGFGSTGDKV